MEVTKFIRKPLSLNFSYLLPEIAISRFFGTQVAKARLLPCPFTCILAAYAQFRTFFAQNRTFFAQNSTFFGRAQTQQAQTGPNPTGQSLGRHVVTIPSLRQTRGDHH